MVTELRAYTGLPVSRNHKPPASPCPVFAGDQRPRHAGHGGHGPTPVPGGVEPPHATAAVTRPRPRAARGRPSPCRPAILRLFTFSPPGIQFGKQVCLMPFAYLGPSWVGQEPGSSRRVQTLCGHRVFSAPQPPEGSSRGQRPAFHRPGSSGAAPPIPAGAQRMGPAEAHARASPDNVQQSKSNPPGRAPSLQQPRPGPRGTDSSPEGPTSEQSPNLGAGRLPTMAGRNPGHRADRFR